MATKNDPARFSTPALDCKLGGDGKYACKFFERGKSIPGAVELVEKTVMVEKPFPASKFNAIEISGNGIDIMASGKEFHAGSITGGTLKCRVLMDVKEKPYISCGSSW
jgi:hypothetical protein